LYMNQKAHEDFSQLLDQKIRGCPR
jgi:hypothetical protein